jgi:hypothetical protein
MSNFKPSLTYKTEDSIFLYRNSSRKSEYVTEVYNTYQEVKSRVKNCLKHEKPIGNTISVSRSRRGEWGEWFEHWELINGKPKIVKEGWM